MLINESVVTDESLEALEKPVKFESTETPETIFKIDEIVKALEIPKVIELEKDNPNKDKLLILGFSPTTLQDGMDFIGKYPGCEVWCMNMFYVASGFPLNLVTRWFEMHEVGINPSVSPKHEEGRIHRANLRGIKCPIYVQDKIKHWNDFPQEKLIEFPAKEIVELFPRSYFSSTPSWIMALAYMEGINELKKSGKFRWKKICVAGVDMMSGWNRKYEVQADGTQKIVDVIASEYASQRPSCEWVIGALDGIQMLGHDFELIIPKGSTLMKYNRLYGYENYFNQGITLDIKERAEIRMKFVDEGITNLQNNITQLQQRAQNEIIGMQRQLDARIGARQELELQYSEYCDPATYYFKEKEDK